MACQTYTPNFDCCDSWADLGTPLRTRAEALAWDAIRFLTGGLVGACPVVLRPCAPVQCSVCSTEYQQVLWSDIRDGAWYGTSPCRTAGCSCTPMRNVTLPGKVAEVTQVMLDGGVLPPTDYRLDNGNELVRTDGLDWPTCQDMRLRDDAPGAFAVTYVPGVKPDAAGLWAVGVLACEFAKACSGEKCRLPASVTTVTRQGTSMVFDNSMFSNMQTGIREVDAYVLSVNPYRLRTPSRVWSPDAGSHRFTGV